MKIYKCDICGKEIDVIDTGAILHDKLSAKYSGLFGTFITNMDICGLCMEIGKRIDFRHALFNLWRDASNC